MREYIMPLLIVVFAFSCGFGNQADLNKMEAAVRQHIKYMDTEKGITTNISYFEALSYEEMLQSERQTPDDFYLCKIYMQGTWAYYNSSRIYNVNDTLRCVFDKKKVFVRIENEDY